MLYIYVMGLNSFRSLDGCRSQDIVLISLCFPTHTHTRTHTYPSACMHLDAY